MATIEKEDHQTNGDTKKVGEQDKKPANPVVVKAEAVKDKLTDKKEKIKDKTDPPGGKDDTPIPPASSSYTVQFTFNRAENLPVSDFGTRSSDPYILATLTSPGIKKRHKDDPDMMHRTRTIHKSTDPEWNDQWIVAGIPSNGFRLKCRLWDEDPNDNDDRLGNVTVVVNNINESWNGFHEKMYYVKKRMGSKRAYALKGCLSMLSRDIHMNGKLFLSVKVLGKSDPPHGRMYTLGPTVWIKHYSPMMGRLAGTKNAEDGKTGKGKTEKYDFQANQMQLQGPVPASLYHRFVEFKPFVKGMFWHTGVRGRILNSVLHHEHNQVYNFGAKTEYGVVKPRSEEASRQFLEMAHYDEGGRIFTYVLLLDGLLRFTETGKEFGIDFLSKHTMHSDVDIYIACSGEFFIRRLEKPDKSATAPDQRTHPSEDLPGGPPNESAPIDPKEYELVIDNDSGTYRPEADLLGELKKFLNDNFPGIHVVVKDCKDNDLSKWKDEQRETKKKQGQNVQLLRDSDGEIDSSDEEALDQRIDGTHKSKKQKAYKALEDPKQAIMEVIPGGEGRMNREEKEATEDMAGEGASKP